MKRVLSYTVLFIVLSLIGHSYVVYRFITMVFLSTGPNDGMEQMVPIQMYLLQSVASRESILCV